jgi:hypothetical protein
MAWRYPLQELVMAEEHKHEEKPWSPRIDGEPLFNPFSNPQDGQPANPVALEGLEDEESADEAEVAPETISPDEPLPASKSE